MLRCRPYGIVACIAIACVAVFLFIRNSFFATPSYAPLRLRVTVSFYPLYFFASTIAGDAADVYNITPAGAEPHDYDPSTRDIARVEDSELLVLNGGKLEAWGDTIQRTLAGTHTKVLVVGDRFADRTVVEDGETIRDPHVWLDPPLAKKEAEAIAAHMELLDPSHASDYAKNLGALDQQLDELDTAYKTGLASCRKKEIMTSHAAFGYVANEYGLTQVPIAGLSTDAEPSLKQLTDIVDFAKKRNISTIFFESLASPKLSETIAREIGASTMVLNPIEGLSAEETSAGKNYLTEMWQNLKNVKIALQCQ